jgi:hypothetical protein
MPTSLAISDISILAPDSSRHFIILKSVSLKSVDPATDSSATEILTTVAGFSRSFNDWIVLSSNGFLMIRGTPHVMHVIRKISKFLDTLYDIIFSYSTAGPD